MYIHIGYVLYAYHVISTPTSPAQVGSDDDGYAVRMRLDHFFRYASDPEHSQVRRAVRWPAVTCFQFSYLSCRQLPQPDDFVRSKVCC